MKREVIGYTKMANELLDNELSSSPFFFASPNNTMMGIGVQEEHLQTLPFSELADVANNMLKNAKTSESDNPVLFGVVPFNQENMTRFVIPKTLYISSSTRASHTSASSAPQARLISSPSGHHYKQGVHDLLGMFANQELSKVVLSRAIEVATETDIQQQALLRNLLSINAKGYTFAAQIGDNQKLMGASPELLVAKKGSHLISNPLAGSRPRSESEQQNQASIQSLLNTGKDLHEHGLVVEEVERVMSKYCCNLYTPMVPSVIETQTMLHLSTQLEGQVLDPAINVLQVAAELHPTPAVCGYPREKAYEAIKRLEQFDRGYFTGMVGWCDSRGNGEWVVTIRCAEVQPRRMKVFAGAGIVNESQPQSELDETGAKMNTILKAAGIQLNEMLTA
ncbi:TPA: isochorismate synthase [Vibrio vulnificus]|uniref:isochorismate synthase n=1 Tax=Vibrio vulnificus TaxID=672 RepID=UPI0019D49EE1|nr:isochorismate synthase [Vibrio vulnificus]MBN8144402.1 isochorismate synthase [Vibrio vulnificus]HAS6159492.1 isochorismate synthase [Vibrio vulnificus]HAS6260835.1 isochorismate synthase [Vibrio vulnificus]HAU8282195.1 isochorismate synthase [Vibrio vulnificus]HDY7504077.1 isochorismate synthase [Vibrio vulnificus]